MLLFENARNLLMKSVKDVYGKEVGQVVCLISNNKGEVTEIKLIGSKNFTSLPSKYFKLENDQLLLLSKWYIDSEELIKEYTQLLRRFSALEELHSKGEISKETYKEFYNMLLKQYEELKRARSSILEELSKSLEEITNTIKELDMAMTVIKIQRSLKEIGEDVFRSLSLVIQTSMNRALAERRDIEQAIQRVKSVPEIKFTQRIEESKQTENKAGQPLTVQVID